MLPQQRFKGIKAIFSFQCGDSPLLMHGFFDFAGNLRSLLLSKVQCNLTL